MRTGMPVFGIDDRSLGQVRAIDSCCFEVTGDVARSHVEMASIYNVDDFRVTLVCETKGVGRYACRVHTYRGMR